MQQCPTVNSELLQNVSLIGEIRNWIKNLFSEGQFKTL